MGFNNKLTMTDGMSDPGNSFSGITANNGMKDMAQQLPGSEALMPPTMDTYSAPRSMQVNPYIKNSGAPVNFSPRSAQNINSMFGTPMENSYDRTMTPYDGSNFTGDQAMY
jgi:hypothetical protein